MTTPHPDDTTSLPWAQTHTLPYAAPGDPVAAEPAVAEPEVAGTVTEAAPASASAQPLAGTDADLAGSPLTPGTAPALNPPTWSGRKTAVAAALAIGFSSMGAMAAAAVLPAGTTQGGGQVQQGGFGPGGRLPGGFTPQGAQPGTQQGAPGTQLPQAPSDPNASRT